MHIDTQTLIDIDFWGSGESNGVFDYIDKTITSEGRNRLIDIFKTPPGSISELRIQQLTIKRLSLNPSTLSLPIKQNQLNSLQEYLDSNIDVISGENLLQTILFYLKDKQSFRYIKYSLHESINTLNNLCHFFDDYKYILIDLFPDIYAELGVLRINQLSLKNLFKLDYLIRCTNKKKILSILESYYKIDALIALAITTNENCLTFPELIEQGPEIINATELYHPLISNAVPACFRLHDSSNLILLTGPNMSGKSTFMKAIGISILFAHVGMGVPAKRMTLRCFDRLFTYFNIGDNTLNNESYFLSEVRRVKVLAQALNRQEKVFALCDEMFKGTNIKDAVDASSSVVSDLAKWEKSAFVISTHLHEIIVRIKHIKNIQYAHFKCKIIKGAPTFTYQLIEGVSDLSLGFYFVENENILKLLNISKN